MIDYKQLHEDLASVYIDMCEVKCNGNCGKCILNTREGCLQLQIFDFMERMKILLNRGKNTRQTRNVRGGVE